MGRGWPMTNIIPPSPLQSVPRDQNSLRKGFSDLTQAINNKFNTIDTHLSTIDTNLALTQSTLYPAQTYSGIVIPAGPNVPAIGSAAVTGGRSFYRIYPDGSIEMWGYRSVQAAWTPSTPYSMLVVIPLAVPVISTESFTFSCREVTRTTLSFPGYYFPGNTTTFCLYILNMVNTYAGSIEISWRLNGRWR
jgi:hypothetical protein